PLRMFRTVGESLSLVARPFALAPVYVLSPARWGQPATLLGVACLLLFAILCALPRVRASRALPLLALLAVTLAPVANVLPLAKEIGDAHLYLPLVPLAGLAALGIEWLAAAVRPAVALA